ncbi:MAG: helicase-related protein [Methanimicrococcus sp.]|nr:helicase-related protein [Methanimicrococcus sp.]
MMKAPKLLDNKLNGKVSDELILNLKKESKLSVISAYFTIYAYAELKKELNKIDSVRFLFTDPVFLKTDKKSREYFIHQKQDKHIFGNEYEIKLRNEMKQAAISKECAAWLEKKAEIKTLRRPNPAQSRLIYIDNEDEHISINGSVDFTTDGLGITPSERIDSNTCVYGSEFTQIYLKMFNSLWEDESVVENIKEEILEQLLVLYKENTPEFIYFVTLYNIFYDFLDELTEENTVKTQTGFKETFVWNKLYKFQKDGAIGAIEKIEKYNGCIIADSVGLGKTFTALAVIKYYELRNDRVLVLCPKKLRDNWIIYTQNDKRNIFSGDRFNYDVLNHTDLSRTGGFSGGINLSTIHWSNYDLVVIDESHNFRNNEPAKGRVTRYERLMNDVIKSGVKTKVLMLSATPVNNRMNDIKNQISFITEGRNDAFEFVGLPKLDLVLNNAQKIFNKWSALPDDERTSERFVEMMDIDYFKLLDIITIARSRRHIQKYYSMDEIGKFPKRLPPINHCSEIDASGNFPPIGDVNKNIKRLTLCIYSPLSYLRKDKIHKYEEKYDTVLNSGAGRSVFKQVDRERNLIGLMRVNLLKRMESSIHSFSITVGKILYNIEKTLEKIDTNEEDYSYGGLSEKDFDSSEFFDPDLDDSDFSEEFMVGGKVKVSLKDVDLIKWRQDLESDRDYLSDILKEAQKVTPDKDQKLIDLRKMIFKKFENPIPGNNENKKILIFTAFVDTAEYLYKNLANELMASGYCSAIVTGAGQNKTNLPLSKSAKETRKEAGKSEQQNQTFSTILTLFSPRSKEGYTIFPDMDREIDILIATDCISEGQNLQDCDYLINYDIHWNPVRIIQRFGRIDRIGSLNESIRLVNFWPMESLDDYIHLKRRVEGRMVMADISATGEDNVMLEEKEMKDLEYRRKQLERLREEVIDLEDISGGISITDLTFNDFKRDLANFLKESPGVLEKAPTGMYAMTRTNEELEEVEPGVLFTLRQIRGAEQTKSQNSLFPYYMVYITNDGEVKLSFQHGKKILDIYKKLCSGQKSVLKDLTDVFNAETNDGFKMDHYSELLADTIHHLVGKKREIGAASIFSKGGTAFHNSSSGGTDDFELVSFLVIK